MKLVQEFLNSITGRVFALLFVGVIVSASLALVLSDRMLSSEREQVRQIQLINRVANFLRLLNRATPAAASQLLQQGTGGMRPINISPQTERPDEAFQNAMKARLGSRIVSVTLAEQSYCFSDLSGDLGNDPCWVVKIQGPDGIRAFALPSRAGLPSRGDFVDPFYLAVLAAGVAVLALFVARMATAPLQRLSQAAGNLGPTLEGEPLPENGPREVRNAAQAFNAMRDRLKQSLYERTQVLSAVTHDLQTPMTRLRLRLEKVKDDDLRNRLVGDLLAMQQLVTEGLLLARSRDAHEDMAILDLDSLLESIAQDATDAGQNVVTLNKSGCDVRVCPQTLRRCIQNLIDNAVRYAGSAEITSIVERHGVSIHVRDRGPGISPDELSRVVEPFYRLETSRSREAGGTGLGLAIASNLAEKTGAKLVLTNHPDGGLNATITYLAFAGWHERVEANSGYRKISTAAART